MWDLRLLGLAFTGVPVSEMNDRMLPWVRIGFAVMVITGVLLFYGIPVRTYQSVWFRGKVIFLILAMINIWYFHCARRTDGRRRGTRTRGCRGWRAAPGWPR